MVKERILLGHYLDSKYEMSEEEVKRHLEFVEHQLKEIVKDQEISNYKRETILGIAFSPLPVPRHRIIEPLDHRVVLDYKEEYTLADDKKKFPSIFDNEFVVGIQTSKRTLFERVYKRYKWNNADIVGVVQLLAGCSKDDRRVILASGLHDFLLEYKYESFKKFRQYSPDLTIEEFRWITSEVYRYLCTQQGMGPIRASFQSNVVDWFQKHFQKKKWQIKLAD